MSAKPATPAVTTESVQRPPKCRIAIVGSSRQRVAKIAALLRNPTADNDGISLPYTTLPIRSLFNTEELEETLTDLEQNLLNELPSTIEIEYISCVATFGSYVNDKCETIRYLVKLEHHGEDGTLVRGQSLAPFFDNNVSGVNDAEIDTYFPGISGAAVGCGIETVEDMEMISGFLSTFSCACGRFTAGNKEDNQEKNLNIMVELIQPNLEYSSMKEENDAYRMLNEEERTEALYKCRLGPGKMAKFVQCITKKTIKQRLNQKLKQKQKMIGSVDCINGSDEAHIDSIDHNGNQGALRHISHHLPDLNKNRYACKRCRTILFGEDDLESPKHIQSLHTFHRKSQIKSSQWGLGISKCSSHFLSNTLSWLNNLYEIEGKLYCYKCNTKIGQYSWTGAQCSCGTWVTPAIMIPMSKVDEIRPLMDNDKLTVHEKTISENFAVGKGEKSSAGWMSGMPKDATV